MDISTAAVEGYAMAHSFLVEQIEQAANAARAAGCYVEVNSMLPTVLVYLGEDNEYFFQEHQADALMEQFAECCLDEVDFESWLLWSSAGW